MTKVKKVNFTMPLEAHKQVVNYQAKKQLEHGIKINFAQAVSEIILQNSKALV